MFDELTSAAAQTEADEASALDSIAAGMDDLMNDLGSTETNELLGEGEER